MNKIARFGKTRFQLCLFLWVALLVSGCSGQAVSSLINVASGANEALVASEAPNSSVSRSGEWVMEGYSPRRDRATREAVLPPLEMAGAFAIGGETPVGSPVAVVGDLLLVEGNHRLHALDLDRQGERWSVDLPGSFVSPAAAGQRIFVRAESGEEGYIIALQADSGQKLWQYQFPLVGSNYGNIGGHVTSPVVVEGLVLVGASQFFRALDAESGQEVWAFNAGEPITSSAAVVDEDVFFTDFKQLHALDLKSGAERWQFAPETEAVTLLFAPVVSGELVITTSVDTVYALDRHSGQLVWERKLAEETLIPAGASGEQVFVKAVKQLYALDRASGVELWSFQAPNFVSLPAITPAHVYVITRERGGAQLRALNREDGEVIWQVEEERLSNAAPVVAGGRVYVCTVDGQVLAYE
jgi:outer membrane protein assembly factor BamB